MIPPCDPCILDQNPQFKRVYENITKNLLNSDGSSCARTVDPARKAIDDELKQYHLQRAKDQIKKNAVQQLAFAKQSELSDECRDTLALISLYLENASAVANPCETARNGESQPQPQAQLQSQAPDDSLALLKPTITSFYTSIPSLIQPFSTLLSESVSTLRILSATSSKQDTTASTATSSTRQPDPESSAPDHNQFRTRARARDHRVRSSLAPLPKVSVQLGQRVEALRQRQISDLPAARRELAVAAAKVMSMRAAVLERMVVILERAKHGTLARGVKARAENLATVARATEGKIELTKLETASTIHTPETVAALRRYQEHLLEIRLQLDERRVVAIEELKKYGFDESLEDKNQPESDMRGGSKQTWEELAVRYGRLLKQIDSANKEIVSLGEGRV
ncbi:Uncharacterized protein PECH_008097 [Penicillium ucsense]|uniref:Uncharacterized protein n=1 Tax=Penicillium ucsense TaxID=2839758 RepID=A0A8J8WKN0_9EURO|nr:Uncharacterized protein PECM_003349 [Penicillium ucsense]KAF7738731.1 Uncharacterized protein PECH_008097 [Penicillium ucsense]